MPGTARPTGCHWRRTTAGNMTRREGHPSRLAVPALRKIARRRTEHGYSFGPIGRCHHSTCLVSRIRRIKKIVVIENVTCPGGHAKAMERKAMCSNPTSPHIARVVFLSRIRRSRRGAAIAQTSETAGQQDPVPLFFGSDRLRCCNFKPVALGALVRKPSPRTCADAEEHLRTTMLKQSVCIKSIARSC